MREDPTTAPDSLDKAIEAFTKMSVPTGPADADVLARLGAIERTNRLPASPAPSVSRWGKRVRILMSSLATIVLLIGVAGLLLFNGSASIALADVVKAAQRHKLVRYRELQITGTNEHDSIVHADLTAPRLRSESRDDEVAHLSVHDGARLLITDAQRKTATLDFAPKGYKSLLCCLEELQEKKGVLQGKDTRDGLAIIKYHLDEETQTTTLWVDAETKLPLRLEQSFLNPAGDSPRRLVWTEFAWDPELPERFRSLEELFSTRPPAGHTIHDLTEGKVNGQARSKK